MRTQQHPTPVDLDQLRGWEGRGETASGTVAPSLVAAFRATLDLEGSDDVPPGLHWCLALPAAPTAGLGEDGHPARGGFLPPVPLPRRMWAGGRLRFADPLRVGDEVTRTSTVLSVGMKEGRTGPLVFVVVEHRIATGRGVSIVEEHDIVYRGPDAGGPETGGLAGRPLAEASMTTPAERRTIEPSAVLLFRYSALTFNGHRIHYDRPYATAVEGYPGLVVHGPLQATLLMGLARTVLRAPLRAFSFRAESPLFDGGPFTIEGGRAGEGASLRVADASGRTTMRATATGAG